MSWLAWVTVSVLTVIIAAGSFWLLFDLGKRVSSVDWKGRV